MAVARDNQDPFAWYQWEIIYDREGDDARAALATAERSNLEANPKMALASAETALKGIPPGTPDWLRAQDIAMVSKSQIKDKKEQERARISERHQWAGPQARDDGSGGHREASSDRH